VLNHAQVSSRPRLGEHASLERVSKSLKTKPIAWARCSTPKPIVQPCNSRLGESDPLGRELQYSSPGLARKHSTPIPRPKLDTTKHSISLSRHNNMVHTSLHHQTKGLPKTKTTIPKPSSHSYKPPKRTLCLTSIHQFSFTVQIIHNHTI